MQIYIYMNRNGSHLSLQMFFFPLDSSLFIFFALSLAQRIRQSEVNVTVKSFRISLLKHNYQLCPLLIVLKLNTHCLYKSVLKNTMASEVFHLNFMVNDKKYISLSVCFVQLIKHNNWSVFFVASYQHSLISILQKLYKDINTVGYNTVKNTK